MPTSNDNVVAEVSSHEAPENARSKRRLHKVAMNLTAKDIENKDKVRDCFNTRTDAGAVSAALSVTASLSEILQKGGELLVRTKDGELEKIIITGLD